MGNPTGTQSPQYTEYVTLKWVLGAGQTLSVDANVNIFSQNNCAARCSGNGTFSFRLGIDPYDLQDYITVTANSPKAPLNVSEHVVRDYVNETGEDQTVYGAYVVFTQAFIQDNSGLVAGGLGINTNIYQISAPVPEPATYGLLSVGLLGVAAAARRRRAQRPVCGV